MDISRDICQTAPEPVEDPYFHISVTGPDGHVTRSFKAETSEVFLQTAARLLSVVISLQDWHNKGVPCALVLVRVEKEPDGEQDAGPIVA